MKYVDELRDARTVRGLAREIARATTRPWTIMEVCGVQTHAIVRSGIDELLPAAITLAHGPGCPVCVTPVAIIDQALAIASRPGVMLCSFGDMLRVPGSGRDLFAVKADGGDVRVVHSPLDALALARSHPGREVVFFGVGFETAAPATAMTVHQARLEAVGNFSLLLSHVLVPPALRSMLSSPRNRVQGFLAAGRVCTVMGWEEYEPLAREFRVPIVVTGFEPLDILEGVALCVRQLEEGRHEVENAYARSMRREGNREARRLIREIFKVVPRVWRGLGPIPASGLGFRPRYAAFDAARRFGVNGMSAAESPDCLRGEVLTGVRRPTECPAFAVRCTPDRPLGAPMVSSEGACAAYFRYRRDRTVAEA